jgi:Glyoxalase/Bleomycin resistance protein/Dioxygenase superfamily.
MILTEIDHVAIAVRDLPAAIDYYQRAFGATSTIVKWSSVTVSKKCS